MSDGKTYSCVKDNWKFILLCGEECTRDLKDCTFNNVSSSFKQVIYFMIDLLTRSMSELPKEERTSRHSKSISTLHYTICHIFSAIG